SPGGLSSANTHRLEVIFKRGMDAYNNPDFYRQLGKAPEQIMAATERWLVCRVVPRRSTPQIALSCPAKATTGNAGVTPRVTHRRARIVSHRLELPRGLLV